MSTPVPLREDGEGSTVLLLHGGGGPESIPQLFAHLALQHRVVMPTHPGWHDTERPAELDSVQRLANHYVELLRSRRAENVTVVGSSFGGWIAAEMALQAGPLVRALVLVDAVGIEPDSSHLPPKGAGTDAPPLPGQSPEAMAAGMAAIEGYTGPDMRDTTLASRLAAVTVPTLVIWGEADPVLTAAYGQALAGSFPNGRLVIIPNAGHLPSDEQPDATGATVDRFLSEIGRHG